MKGDDTIRCFGLMDTANAMRYTSKPGIGLLINTVVNNDESRFQVEVGLKPVLKFRNVI
jgi:hypothetical protein